MSRYADLIDNKINVTVKDMSATTLDPLPLTNKIAFLAPLFASYGKENLFQIFHTLGDFYSEFGEDVIDVKKYGQQGANAVHALQGGARVYAAKLLPSDAKAAGIVLQVHIKEEPVIPQWERDEDGNFKYDGETDELIPIMIDNPEGEGKIQKTLPGYKVKLVAVEPSESGRNDGAITTKEGWNVFPLLKFSSYKKGVVGNSLGFSIINDYSRDTKVTDGRRYYFNFVQATTAGTVEATSDSFMQFAFNTEAKLSSTSNISESILEVYQNIDENRGYNYRDLLLNYYEENYLEIINKLSERFNQAQNSDFDIDFITCTDFYGQKYDTIILDEDSIMFKEGGENVFLMGGHEGSLQLGNTVKNAEGQDVTVTEDIVKATKRDLLKKCFQFKVDKRLADCRKVGAGIVLDAAYDSDIKKEMGTTLIEVRPDIFVMFDCGITSNMQEAISVSKDIKSLVNSSLFNHAIFPHCGKAKDLKLNAPITQTYEVAYSLPVTYTNKGSYSIMCSYQTGIVRTLLPDWVVEGADEEKTIEKYSLCYLVELGDITGSKDRFAEKEYFQWAQKTLYNDNLSVLKNLRNALVITDLIRLCRLILIKYVNDTQGAEAAMEKATAEMKMQASSRYPTNISTNFVMYQTKRDKQLRTCSCDISVTFPNEIETFNVTIFAYRQSLE